MFFRKTVWGFGKDTKELEHVDWRGAGRAKGRVVASGWFELFLVAYIGHLLCSFARKKGPCGHTTGVLVLAGMNGTPSGGIQFNHVPFFKAWS